MADSDSGARLFDADQNRLRGVLADIGQSLRLAQEVCNGLRYGERQIVKGFPTAPGQVAEAWLPSLFPADTCFPPPSQELEHLGYGFMTQLPGSDKPPIMGFAFSSNPEDRQTYTLLLERFSSHIVHLANHIRLYGQLSPIVLNTSHQIVLGRRRFMAAAYNAIKHGNEPMSEVTIQAQVRDIPADRTIFVQLGEAIGYGPFLAPGRLNLMELARIFKTLRDAGLTVLGIADGICIDHQHVRQCLLLLNLPPAQQARVEEEGDRILILALRRLRNQRQS